MEWRILDARFIQPNLRIIHAWVVILFVYLQSGLVAVVIYLSEYVHFTKENGMKNPWCQVYSTKT